MNEIKIRKKTGGKMPGAGRPKSDATLKAQVIRKYLVKEALKAKKPITDALIKKAKEGDLKAIAEVLDRVLGKAAASLDLTSKGSEMKLVALPPLLEKE